MVMHLTDAPRATKNMVSTQDGRRPVPKNMQHLPHRVSAATHSSVTNQGVYKYAKFHYSGSKHK